MKNRILFYTLGILVFYLSGCSLDSSEINMDDTNLKATELRGDNGARQISGHGVFPEGECSVEGTEFFFSITLNRFFLL